MIVASSPFNSRVVAALQAKGLLARANSTNDVVSLLRGSPMRVISAFSPPPTRAEAAVRAFHTLLRGGSPVPISVDMAFLAYFTNAGKGDPLHYWSAVADALGLYQFPVEIPSADSLATETKWLAEEVARLGEVKLARLAESAAEVRRNAYKPYSGYAVGAAILCISGLIAVGCNAEVVSFSETDHAERSAITAAIAKGEVTKGGREFIRAIAVSHANPSFPCGGCRQRILEHAENSIVVMADPDGKIQGIGTARSLLPFAFLPRDLDIK